MPRKTAPRSVICWVGARPDSDDAGWVGVQRRYVRRVGVRLPGCPRRDAQRAQQVERRGRCGRTLPGLGVGERRQQQTQRAVGSGPTRRPPGQQLGRDHACGVHVLPRVGRGAGDLLGRHVTAGADASEGSGEPGVAGRDRDAEVAEADPRPAGAGGLEEEVARLDVAVHQARRVHRHQGLEHLVEHHANVAVGQRTVPGEQLLQVAAAHQVHGEEVAGATRGLHDVAVPHPQPSLPREPLEGGGVVGASQLGRDPAPLVAVPGAPDRAHAAGADLVGHQVAAAGEHGPRHDPGNVRANRPVRRGPLPACGLGWPGGALVASAGCPTWSHDQATGPETHSPPATERPWSPSPEEVGRFAYL